MRSARVTGGNQRAVENGEVGGTANMAEYRRQPSKSEIANDRQVKQKEGT